MGGDRVEILGVLRPWTGRRFLAKLERRGGCLVYVGHRNGRGYGVLEVTGVDGGRYAILAHRLAWVLEHGEIGEGEVVHPCRRDPACCEVEHLRLGRVTRRTRVSVPEDRVVPVVWASRYDERTRRYGLWLHWICGRSMAAVAAELGCRAETVSGWRTEFERGVSEGLFACIRHDEFSLEDAA